ncbi:hypothetical protein CR513_14102, partial [Mucuna pruriens]
MVATVFNQRRTENMRELTVTIDHPGPDPMREPPGPARPIWKEASPRWQPTPEGPSPKEESWELGGYLPVKPPLSPPLSRINTNSYPFVRVGFWKTLRHYTTCTFRRDQTEGLSSNLNPIAQKENPNITRNLPLQFIEIPERRKGPTVGSQCIRMAYGHSTEDCHTLQEEIERLVQEGHPPKPIRPKREHESPSQPTNTRRTEKGEAPKETRDGPRREEKRRERSGLPQRRDTRHRGCHHNHFLGRKWCRSREKQKEKGRQCSISMRESQHDTNLGDHFW